MPRARPTDPTVPDLDETRLYLVGRRGIITIDPTSPEGGAPMNDVNLKTGGALGARIGRDGDA